jgi:hypothetical protein
MMQDAGMPARTRRVLDDNILKVPFITDGDYVKVYKDAHKSVPRAMAYCCISTYRQLYRYLRSAACPPALTIVVQLDGQFPLFKDIMQQIDSFASNDSLPDSLDGALTLWPIEQAKQTMIGQEKEAKDQRSTRAKLMAFVVYWLVHEGPKVLKQDTNTLQALWSKQKLAFEQAVGASDILPDLDYTTPVVKPTFGDGEVFHHPKDQSVAERYHRALQLLRMAWNASTGRQAKNEDPSPINGGDKESAKKWALQWKEFWNNPKVDSEEEVTIDDHGPYWMRSGTGQPQGS